MCKDETYFKQKVLQHLINGKNIFDILPDAIHPIDKNVAIEKVKANWLTIPSGDNNRSNVTLRSIPSSSKLRVREISLKVSKFDMVNV